MFFSVPHADISTSRNYVYKFQRQIEFFNKIDCEYYIPSILPSVGPSIPRPFFLTFLYPPIDSSIQPLINPSSLPAFHSSIHLSINPPPVLPSWIDISTNRSIHLPIHQSIGHCLPISFLPPSLPYIHPPINLSIHPSILHPFLHF